jgi:outer membrane protein OmpA-like peptidoglycan-associated protein
VAAVPVLADSDRSPPVRIFEDEPPSVEQLRNILVPESSPGGLSRRLEFPKRDSIGGPKQAQPAAASADVTGSSSPAAQSGAPSVSTVNDLPAAKESATVPADAAAPAAGSAVGSVGFRINFALNSATVPPTYYPYVDRIGELLRQEVQVKLLIEGHTDATGSDAYNLDLSQRRALAVAEYLVRRRGIDPERLLVTGKGKREPLTDDPYDPRNRRVQFVRVE